MQRLADHYIRVHHKTAWDWFSCQALTCPGLHPTHWKHGTSPQATGCVCREKSGRKGVSLRKKHMLDPHSFLAMLWHHVFSTLAPLTFRWNRQVDEQFDTQTNRWAMRQSRILMWSIFQEMRKSKWKSVDWLISPPCFSFLGESISVITFNGVYNKLEHMENNLDVWQLYGVAKCQDISTADRAQGSTTPLKKPPAFVLLYS